MTALQDLDVVSDGKTAFELGKLLAWNSGAAENKGDSTSNSAHPSEHRDTVAVPFRGFRGTGVDLEPHRYFSARSRLDDPVPNGIPNQIADRVHAELVHDVGPVCFDG